MRPCGAHKASPLFDIHVAFGMNVVTHSGEGETQTQNGQNGQLWCRLHKTFAVVQ